MRVWVFLFVDCVRFGCRGCGVIGDSRRAITAIILNGVALGGPCIFVKRIFVARACKKKKPAF